MVEITRTELTPETTLSDGKYIIEKKIGAGGFGITYAARHAKLGQRYAIKEFFLSGYNVRNTTTNHISLQGIEEADYDKFRLKFIEEAKTLASLSNEAIVKVLDIFDENGTSYMVMPFVEGSTLQDIVEASGPLDADMAVNYIILICEALDYIHKQKILHRDVTPDNIIVTPEQKIVLIDFGSARKFINDKTQRHTTIIKKGYAPLEQYSATSRKGAYTDIYSLGAVYYYLLTGIRPIDATERTLEKLQEPKELNPSISSQTNAIIMKAMNMDTAKRYQNVNDLMDDIFSGNNPDEPEHTDGAVPIVETNTVEEPPVPKKSNKIVPVILTALAIAAIGFIIFRKSTSPDKTHPSVLKTPTEIIADTIRNAEQININHDSLNVLSFDPNNPEALYGLATRAIQEGLNEFMDSLWNNDLVPSGDVEAYLKQNRGKTSIRFAFVCAARAYNHLDKYPQSSEADSLKNDIRHMLDSLQTLAPENMIYDNDYKIKDNEPIE